MLTESYDALLAHLVAAGYRRTEPPILQPASVFLDLAGEDIRGRIFLTSDGAGNEFCLRPEYTIPVCRAYLASDHVGRTAQYSYLGPVFRYRGDQWGEFAQAGLENFGSADREAADAEILVLALEAAREAGGAQLDVRFGDAGLFARLLETLDLPPVWLRRIRRGQSQGQSLDQILVAPKNGGSTDHSGLLTALENVGKAEALALVRDLLSIAGFSSVGGRSAVEIAERFLEQAALKAGAGVSAEQRGIIEQFLAVSGDPDTASHHLRTLASQAKLDLGAALDSYDARLGFIAARGVNVSLLNFEAGFTRNLDYYTGFVFEAQDPARIDTRPIIGGGRYDRLLKTLGAADDIPAVGAAIWCDRLAPSAGGGHA
ncbi:MAG TPA: ATP phosphoribosyltransferase regulatory subunit [Beijerinckiaceae bacterium]|nr:ATP phosphoribosyltransferase regulatory subunit [Beijerinckiaceae bacterium]